MAKIVNLDDIKVVKIFGNDIIEKVKSENIKMYILTRDEAPNDIISVGFAYPKKRAIILLEDDCAKFTDIQVFREIVCSFINDITHDVYISENELPTRLHVFSEKYLEEVLANAQ